MKKIIHSLLRLKAKNILVNLAFISGILLIQLPSDSLPHAMMGYASFYHPRFHGTCCTASGERVNIYGMTAAHRSLPLGSWVRVTNVRNRRSVVVRINDRGPYGGGRVIDLSLRAFRAIAQTDKGMVWVRLQPL